MTNKLLAPLALAFTVAGSSPALAQTGKPLPARPATAAPAQGAGSVSAETVAARADALTANMSQALSLTPAQVEKVRAININSVRNVEAARVRYRQEPGKLRQLIESVGLSRLEQLKDVLTPGQFARYQQKREEKMGIPTVQGSQGNPPPGLGSGRGENE